MRSMHSTASPARSRGISAWVAGAFALVLMLASPFAQARVLKLDRLEPKVVARMSKESREKYEQGLAALDRILYPKALTELQGAMDLDQQNDHLRFMIVQLATYLGDTNWGSDAISFYGVAIDNMKALSVSDRLNLREQERALEAVDRLTALQKAVTERDERRREWGMQIAKEFRKKIDESDKDSKSASSGTGSRGGLPALGTAGGGRPLTVSGGGAPGVSGASLSVTGGNSSATLGTGPGAIQGGNLSRVGGYVNSVTR